MHTAHLANVSKSVTKNATFSRTGGLPCLITHSCMSAASPTVVGGLIFCISATPHLGCLFPLFHEIHADKMNMLGKDYEAENECENMVFECVRKTLTIAPFSMLLKFCFYIIVGQNKIIYIWFFSSKFVLTLK